MEKRETGILLCDFLSGREIPQAKLEKLSLADWESLVDLALHFNVGELFYREIKSSDFLARLIPVNAKNRLRNKYRNLAAINTCLFFDAAKIIKSFDDHQLPVIALKGLSLAKNIYGDIALRPMCDIDLLVKKEDLARAGHLLLTLGYKQNFPSWESMLKTHYHLPPFKDKDGGAIELHWNIVLPDSPIKTDLDGLWERVRFIKVDNVEVRALSLEDLFLHLCVHACFDLQNGLSLIHLCDIAGLIKTSANKIDWQIVIERATQWGGKKCVYLMLLLVRELLGVAPPDRIIFAIKPDDYQPVFFDQALEQILDISSSGHLIINRMGKLSRIKEVKGIKSKVSAFLREAFPSKESLARMYPVSVSSPKIYLCYLFRLRRLTAYYTIVFFQLFRRDQSVMKAVHHKPKVRAVSDWMFS